MLWSCMSDTLVPIHKAPVDVADKLIKIMSIVRGSTDEHEIQAAMAKAQAFAIKNRIDIATVEIEDAGVTSGDVSRNDDPITQIRFQSCKGDKRRPPADKWITSILLQFFNVKLVHSGSTIWVIGRTSDAKFAEYAYFFLKNRFSALWVKHKQAHNCLMEQRNSFYAGIHSGLMLKLIAAKEQTERETFAAIDEKSVREKVNEKYSMMVVTEKAKLEQATKDYHPNLRKCSTKWDTNVNYRGNDFSKGVTAGQDIEISRPIGDGSTKDETIAGMIEDED